MVSTSTWSSLGCSRYCMHYLPLILFFNIIFGISFYIFAVKTNKNDCAFEFSWELIRIQTPDSG